MDNSLFQRAKANADIVKVAGVKLYGGGHKKRGVCPLCHQGEKSKAYAFEVDTRLQRFRCFACDERGGDVIELEHRLHGQGGETMVDAAKRLAGDAPAADRPEPRPEVAIAVPEGPTRSEIMARTVVAESIAAPHTLVQRYLLNRGIAGRVMTEAVKRLRFHACVYHSGPSFRPVAFPGMIATPEAYGGPTGGMHATYIARDGSGKAPVPKGEKAKKMWGPQSIGGCPGGFWLADPDGEGPIVVAEGIETALSLAILLDEPCRPVAALSLGRLQGGIVRDKYGRIDPDVPLSDPDAPAFTWPVPKGQRVIIGVDHDMSPLRVKVRQAMRGGTVDRVLSATERARLCGSLASQAWRRMGAVVEVKAPPLGEDFNDMLRRQQQGRVA